MARTATAEEIVSALGITDRTLRGWRSRGCPADPAPKGRGRPGWRFDADEVRAWAEANELGIQGGGTRPDERPERPAPGAGRSSQPAAGAQLAGTAPSPAPGAAARQALAEGRARKVELEVEAQQIKLAQARGALVALEQVRAFWEGQVAIVKAYVSALPGRLAPQLVEQPYEEIHARLERELDSMLEAFAAGEVPGPHDPPSTHLEAQPHGGALLRYDSRDEP